MRTASRALVALLILTAVACATTATAPRDPAEQIASQSFDAMSLRYDAVQAEVRGARLAGRINGAQWDNEWMPLQFAVSGAAAGLAADLATWRTGGVMPPTYEQRRAALETAVVNAEAYAKGIRP